MIINKTFPGLECDNNVVSVFSVHPLLSTKESPFLEDITTNLRRKCLISISIQARVMVFMMRDLLGSFLCFNALTEQVRDETQCKWTVVELHVPQIYST
jgi:hypothetical protein